MMLRLTCPEAVFLYVEVVAWLEEENYFVVAMQTNVDEGTNRGSIRDIFDYLGCLLLFVMTNVFLFHAGLYNHISHVDSYAGNAFGRLSVLRELEKSQDKKAIALIGDSTTEEGLDAKELSQLIGKPVANLALPGTGPTEWFHFLRSIDPKQDRFETIIIMIALQNMRSRPHEDGVQTLLPVASVNEILSYAWRFDEASRKMEYTYAAFDKIFAHRRDLRDLILSPGRMFTIRKQKKDQFDKLNNWPGQTFDVCGVRRDPATEKITNWGQLRNPEIRKLAKNTINRTRQLNNRPVVSGILEPLSDIIDEYKNSKTKLVVLTVPFSMEHRIRPNSKSIQNYYLQLQKLTNQSNVWHWNAVSESFFRDCRNFYDFRHLNERGRRILTERLAMELLNIDSEYTNCIN